MKFTLFALIVSMCLLGANSANIFQELEHDLMDIEKTGIVNWLVQMFDETYALLKKTLRDLEGVDCLVNNAVTINKAAVELEPKLEACGVPKHNSLTPIINGAKEVSVIVEEILLLRKNFCIGDKGKSPISCIHNLLSNIFKLHSQSKTLNASIKTVMSSGEITGDCYLSTLKNLQNELTVLPAEIKVCAKSL